MLHQTTRRYVTVECRLCSPHCENLKSEPAKSLRIYTYIHRYTRTQAHMHTDTENTIVSHVQYVLAAGFNYLRI
jgi:hypothetical protein